MKLLYHYEKRKQIDDGVFVVDSCKFDVIIFGKISQGACF